MRFSNKPNFFIILCTEFKTVYFYLCSFIAYVQTFTSIKKKKKNNPVKFLNDFGQSESIFTEVKIICDYN